MEFLKKILAHIKTTWGKWGMRQRLILIGSVAVVIVVVIALFSVSSSPSLVPVIDRPITDQTALDRIVQRINEENVKVTVSSMGLVQVADESIARRMRTILIREDLIPTGIDPWSIFDKERWTITDFERNVNFRRAQTQMITDHIRSIDGVDNANVTIVVPDRRLLVQQQNPVSASVIITPTPGSDITTNRKKIEGIQKLIKLAIEGLLDENIVITDHYGNPINDFAGMAETDRLDHIAKQNKMIQQQETLFRAQLLQQLQTAFSGDRVREVNVKVAMDMSKKAVNTEEYYPIEMVPEDPTVPYTTRVTVPSITIGESMSTTGWRGTGFNPEGPSGVEGQTPPAFKDMSNLYGEMTQETRTHNEVVNLRKIQEERSPQIDRVSVSVIVDGVWQKKYDEKRRPIILPNGSIEREYTPVPPEQLRQAENIIQKAIGYRSDWGDTVTVQNIPFDRTKEFNDEDAAYFKKKQVQTTIIIFLSGLTLLLVAFIIFRVIAREMERRRRLAEEEQEARMRRMRESAMLEAEQEGMEVSISMEDRSRMELMESVVNLAKEHPQDCAQLIKTWLLEEN